VCAVTGLLAVVLLIGLELFAALRGPEPNADGTDFGATSGFLTGPVSNCLHRVVTSTELGDMGVCFLTLAGAPKKSVMVDFGRGADVATA
jgi:hypothetical protein